MTEQQLHALEPALAAFLDQFLFCCAYTQTFGHLGTYVRGLLSDLPRKTCEPIALQAGTPVRTLQEFLKDHHWDADAVRQRLQRHTAALLPTLPADDLGNIGLIDETSSVKQGTKTPTVARQYLGCVGKVQNGIVTVHLGVCRGRFQTLLDFDSYLPKDWADDRPRCRAAGIPDAVAYRPKWQIALEQIDRALAHDVPFDWLTFDEEYGKCPGFRAGLDERGLLFVGEVPRSCSCLAVHRSGRRPAQRTKGRTAEDVVRSASAFRTQRWQLLRLTRQTLADQVWRVKAAQVWLHGGAGWSARSYWLIWASNDATAEEKFFLANAPADTPVERLVRVAFRRACVEHTFRLCKAELGFTHFEGRNYVALQRHLSLCLLALTLVAEHTQRLRGEKCGTDGGAGLPGVGGGVPGVAAAAAADQRGGVSAGDHSVPPEAQPRGAAVAPEETTRRAQAQETSATAA
jgi:SRSO17 transposase